MKRFFLPCLAGCIAVATAGCIPAHLQKYSRGDGQSDSRELTSPVSSTEGLSPRLESQAGQRGKEGQSAGIFAVDDQTFRIVGREDEVWDAAMQVLLKNYNLTIVDRGSGIITTEWDSFYLRSVVYRNKVSLRVKKSGRTTVDLMIRNSVEKLQDGAAAGAVGAVWLPSEDVANEVARLVQNVALALNQPPPVMAPGSVAIKPKE